MYSASDSSSHEFGDSTNCHSASEEEEENVVVVAEAPVVTIEEDGSDIDCGNVDNFPAVPSAFEEEPKPSSTMAGAL